MGRAAYEGMECLLPAGWEPGGLQHPDLTSELAAGVSRKMNGQGRQKGTKEWP